MKRRRLQKIVSILRNIVLKTVVYCSICLAEDRNPNADNYHNYIIKSEFER